MTDPNVYKDKSPGYCMNGRNHMPGDNTLKPGPGAHSPEKVSSFVVVLSVTKHFFVLICDL